MRKGAPVKWKELMDAERLLSRYRGAVMGFAALWIMLMHCWLMIVPNRPILGAIEAFGKGNGVLGLDMFLFYSGLSQTYAIRKYPLRQYYVHRIRRVLLPYWAMAAAYALYFGWSAGKFISNALFISFLTKDIFSFLWFVPAILLIYLLFPAYHRLMMRFRNKTAFTLLALGVWLTVSLLLRDVLRYDVWYMSNRIPGFLLGVLVGELARERELCMTRKHWALCVIVLIISWILRDAGKRNVIGLLPQFDAAASVGVAIALCLLMSGTLAAMERRGGAIRAAGGAIVRMLSFVGAFTLELYCTHELCFSVIYTMLEGHVSYLVINMIVLPSAVVVGWLTYRIHMLLWRCVDSAYAKRKL